MRVTECLDCIFNFIPILLVFVLFMYPAVFQYFSQTLLGKLFLFGIGLLFSTISIHLGLFFYIVVIVYDHLILNWNI